MNNVKCLPGAAPYMKPDPFVILSENKIIRVLERLSVKNRLEWIDNSAYVREIANKHNIS